MIVQGDTAPLPTDTSACLGAFDGIHRGHLALLRRAREVASRVAVVTFEPHPVRVIAPDRAPRRLQTAEQRRRRLESLGIDHLVVLPFDDALSRLSPADFVDHAFIHGLRPGSIVVGEDFRYGQGRAGTPTSLATSLAGSHIDVHIVAPILVPDLSTKISSTLVRQRLTSGDVQGAGDLLGRWHTVAGRVMRGHARGRILGFPTANVACPEAFLPEPGVYATFFCVWDPRSALYGRPLASVSNLGTNPTFADRNDAGLRANPDFRSLSLETHLIEAGLRVDPDALYDLEVEVGFVRRLRPESKFEEPGDLARQIAADISEALAFLTPDAYAAMPAPSSP